ncbi:N-acetylmuramoyl-L-alanine amidase [Tissierella praeacuta DSM 18095]|uniref:N-acetylmuramoyl-L-alanine amidase n=1 Tax=Tissierella praeacuta DSM 18095 TaxID=1123404 RepID=A0A1M4Z241_9FIRM|nr:N-acetylmuramoyl-L-alanine amidase [Tissierella praeacuta]SHF12070.1 N-acetylmuramoyl-L-alanine amidase [Tissierella praeacuta DSM 18095]SUP00616.1 Sporulation-specific N-acetylmuramoyl-L-alanine amidase [Tissierella praeacuta]
MVKVHIDFGHGGKDPGAVGNGLKEKDITLSVGLKIGEILKRHNVEVSYSRTTDTFIELSDRAKMTNQAKADIFVSIHVNSATNALARGVETFSHTGSSKGAILAKDIQDSIVQDKIFTVNRGIKTANFAVLRLTKMPAALAELGFISNSEDAKILRNKQSEIAESVAKGILKNLGIKYIEKPKENQNKIKVNVKGQLYHMDGFMKDKTNYVSIRQIAEALGCKVDWDDKTQTVVIK